MSEYKAKTDGAHEILFTDSKDVAGSDYPHLRTHGAQAKERSLLRVTKAGNSPDRKANFSGPICGRDAMSGRGRWTSVQTDCTNQFRTEEGFMAACVLELRERTEQSSPVYQAL